MTSSPEGYLKVSPRFSSSTSLWREARAKEKERKRKQGKQRGRERERERERERKGERKNFPCRDEKLDHRFSLRLQRHPFVSTHPLLCQSPSLYVFIPIATSSS